MDLAIAGKRALVMSSSAGIGLAIAEGLAAEGVEVVLTGRNVDALTKAVADIRNRGGKASFVVADLTTVEGLDALKAAAGGSVDILVCNTGGPPTMAASAVDSAHWRKQLDAMIIPITELTNSVLPGMRSRQWGRIVTVASSGVVQPIPNLAISNALRAAVQGWSKTLASEVARDGVTVNVMLPGRIQTDRVTSIDAAAAKASGKSQEDVAAASQQAIPIGRYGRVEEFAAMAVFLSSAQASYITGTTVRVDGGMIRSV